MLIANITDKAQTVAAQGDFLTITADVCAVIAAVYQKLDDKRGGNMTREMFRHGVMGFLADEDSPLFVPMGGTAAKPDDEVSEE